MRKMNEEYQALSADERSALILDYVKDRVTPEQRSLIEYAVQHDDAAREELVYYEGLNRAMKAPSVSAPANELGWRRLANEISNDRAPGTRPHPIARFFSANDNAAGVRRFAAMGMAIALALVVQSALIGQNRSTVDDPGYITASDSEQQFQAAVVFAPSASLAEVTELLRAVDGEIVAGPSALGLYSVRFASDTKLTNGLAAMKARSEIIESASLK